MFPQARCGSRHTRMGPRWLRSTSRTATWQKVVALALALASKRSAFGLGLEDHGHWPWKCWPRNSNESLTLVCSDKLRYLLNGVTILYGNFGDHKGRKFATGETSCVQYFVTTRANGTFFFFCKMYATLRDARKMRCRRPFYSYHFKVGGLRYWQQAMQGLRYRYLTVRRVYMYIPR